MELTDQTIVITRNSTMPKPMPDGLIVLIDKESDCTSFDVVAKLRKILKVRKIGHAGTLDPFATGLLMLLVGKATKIQDSLMATDKVYEAEIKLGSRTDSLDRTGQVTATSDKTVSEEEIRSTVMSFKGEIIQLPPMFSAVKKNGTRLYELARKGIEIERDPRKIIIHSIEIIRIEGAIIKIRVHCSKGTYIRTLADDIGKKLGTFAHLKELRRISTGIYDIKDAVTIGEFQLMAGSL